MIKTYTKGANIQLSDNFNLDEFDCHCTQCTITLVSLPHVKKLQALRDLLGTSIKITSAYRCPSHNAAVGGSKNSQHMKGNATDIQVKTDIKLVRKVCEVFDGLGLYKTFTHIDSRGTKARWDKTGLKHGL